MDRKKRIRLVVAVLLLLFSILFLVAAFWPLGRVRYILPLPPVSAPLSYESFPYPGVF